jgi:hypothetical protein
LFKNKITISKHVLQALKRTQTGRAGLKNTIELMNNLTNSTCPYIQFRLLKHQAANG